MNKEISLGWKFEKDNKGYINDFCGNEHTFPEKRLYTAQSQLSAYMLLGSIESKIRKSLLALETRILNYPSVSIGGEVNGPGHKSGTLMLSRGDRVAANGGDDTGIAQGRRGGDHGVCDEVVN